MLIEAAEDRGPILFARMGMLRAIEREPEKRPAGRPSPRER
jgi:hypothetical protein